MRAPSLAFGSTRLVEALPLTVLITRPEEDAPALKAEVEALGYSAMIEPLLSIEPLKTSGPTPEDVQALALTSAHAAPALTDEARAYPIYAVGEATAAAARAAGCRNLHIARGNARNLARLIVENCRYQDGSILHLSGEVIREGLAEALRDHGFRYRRRAVYRAVPSTGFSEETVDAWRRRVIKAVLLFSPRSAEVLVHLLKGHGLESQVDSTVAICLSDATAEPCKELSWKAICPSARPSRQALLEALVGSVATC